jgi:hypothetical protein
VFTCGGRPKRAAEGALLVRIDPLLLAYVDVFCVSSIFAVGMVPLVLLLLKRVELGIARPAAH